MPTSHGWSRVRVRQAVSGCVLEGDADAAARGVFDDLFGLAVEEVEGVHLQAATGGRKGVSGYTGGPRDPPTRRTRRTIEGSIAWMRMQKACRKQGGWTGDQGTRCERGRCDTKRTLESWFEWRRPT